MNFFIIVHDIYQYVSLVRSTNTSYHGSNIIEYATNV